MTRRRSSSAGAAVLLPLLEESYRTVSWHGTNLRGSLRGLTPAQLAWRPSPDRHNIWEIALHCAYWKYVVRRRITGEKRGSFPLAGSNFFRRPVRATAAAWREDLRLLDEMHDALVSEVGRLSDARLRARTATGRFTNRQLVTGAAAHDLYHAGQIQLLKRLQSRL